MKKYKTQIKQSFGFKAKVVSADLSNLHNVVNNDVVKKTSFKNWLEKSMLSVVR